MALFFNFSQNSRCGHDPQAALQLWSQQLTSMFTVIGTIFKVTSWRSHNDNVQGNLQESHNFSTQVGHNFDGMGMAFKMAYIIFMTST